MLSFQRSSRVKLEATGPAQLAGWFTHAGETVCYYDVVAVATTVNGSRQRLTVRMVRDAGGLRVADPEWLLRRLLGLG